MVEDATMSLTIKKKGQKNGVIHHEANNVDGKIYVQCWHWWK